MVFTPTDSPTMTADQAIQRLIEGNQRFLRGEARFPTVQKEILAELARGQQPYATLLGCSDSRVPPELLFDAGFGELFVIRVAGNTLSPEVMGSMQYAGLHLHTPLFVILGHEGCGAVKAAMATKHDDVQHRSRIQVLVEGIIPGLPELDPALSADAQLAQAVEANVRWTMRQLLESPEGQARLEEGRMKLVGAVCEIETGRVRFIE